jgi:glycosyltransferase involved in cell wall biosynthesis
VLEAMASGLAVVVTHAGGVAEIVADGKTGFLASPGDLHKMSEKVVILLRDKNLRQTIGENARESLDFNFSLENMVTQTQNLYENLIITKPSVHVN